MTVPGEIWFLDYLSVLVFALTGALVASRAQLDMVGFVFLALLTAVGGGTIRDLVLSRGEVFWVARPSVILVAAGAAFLVFWTAHLLESRYRAMLWLDALALAVAVSAGVGVAHATGAAPLVLKQRELYLTAAFGGALLAAALIGLGASHQVAEWVCMVLTFALRAGAIRRGWRIPTYKSRPPRH